MTTVRSLGATATLDMAQWPKAAGGVTLYDNYTYDYATMYRTQPNVRLCVDFIARNIAQLGLHVYRRVSDTDRERLSNHGLALSLKQPNPFTTRFRFIQSVFSDLGIYENAYALKMPGKRGQITLLPVPPPWVTTTGGFAPELYEVNLGTSVLKVEPSAMLHFRGYSPDSRLKGMSRLETLRRVLAEEYAAGEWREGFWKSSAKQSLIIERPASAGEFSLEAQMRWREEFEALYAGGPGRTMILEEGMTAKPIAFDAQESEYLLGRKLTRLECVIAYFIPPPMAGILDDASFSNITEQHKMLYQDTLAPLTVMAEEEIELQLLPEFEDVEGVYCEFNLEEKLKGSFEEQVRSLQSATGGPYMTRNEARARMNLPRIPGADDLVVPLNVTRGGQASPRDSGDQNRAAILARFVDRQERVLRSNGGRYDAERWQRELAEDLALIGG